MIQVSNGLGRLATVDIGADGRVILELENTEPPAPARSLEELRADYAKALAELERADAEIAAGTYTPAPVVELPRVLGMYLEPREAALLAVAILNAHLGGEAWRNLERAFPRTITPEISLVGGRRQWQKK